jgi:hypothetical protein
LRQLHDSLHGGPDLLARALPHGNEHVERPRWSWAAAEVVISAAVAGLNVQSFVRIAARPGLIGSGSVIPD